MGYSGVHLHTCAGCGGGRGQPKRTVDLGSFLGRCGWVGFCGNAVVQESAGCDHHRRRFRRSGLVRRGRRRRHRTPASFLLTLTIADTARYAAAMQTSPYAKPIECTSERGCNVKVWVVLTGLGKQGWLSWSTSTWCVRLCMHAEAC